ncbi:hypothetical protein GCM10009789_54880 [Kribbella sancticallisti]|uniref:Secreted protein n=1 Tax=Kribbella sancticallisti TaxID=460087 RepID=A0ABN2E1X6_9ACTN
MLWSAMGATPLAAGEGWEELGEGSDRAASGSGVARGADGWRVVDVLWSAMGATPLAVDWGGDEPDVGEPGGCWREPGGGSGVICGSG